MNMKINIEYVPSAKHDEKLEDAVRSKMKKMRDAVGNAEKSAGCEKRRRMVRIPKNYTIFVYFAPKNRRSYGKAVLFQL